MEAGAITSGSITPIARAKCFSRWQWQLRHQSDPGNIHRHGRLVTRGKFEPLYGRIEAWLKLPYGQCIWPAFWMLGTDIGKPGVGWPKCREIDIMEHIGREPFTAYGTPHGSGYSGGHGLSASYQLPNGQRFSDDFHVFAVEWSPRLIQVFVDGILYKARTPADMPQGASWAFDHSFYLLLNLAVGGNWPGFPDVTTVFRNLCWWIMSGFILMSERTRIVGNE